MHYARELYGVWIYFLFFATLMRASHFLFGLDNVCFVFILGGVVPPSATGGKDQKSPSGGSQKPELQALAVQILELCLPKDITFVVNPEHTTSEKLGTARNVDFFCLFLGLIFLPSFPNKNNG